MRRYIATAITLGAVVVLGACSDDDDVTGYLSYGDSLLVCEEPPNPDTGECATTLFAADSFSVLDAQGVDTAPAGDRTISLEQVHLRISDPLIYEARPIDE